MKIPRADRRLAGRVALISSLIGLAAYVASVVVLNTVLSHRLVDQTDSRLSAQLHALAVSSEGNPAKLPAHPARDEDTDDAPIFFWFVTSAGSVTVLTTQSPPLPRSVWGATSRTVTVGHHTFRFDSVALGTGRLVGGESLAGVGSVESVLLAAEIIFGVVVFALMVAAAYLIGIRAITPVVNARRRQAAFAADASHEMRTPLSVINAEVDVALGQSRDADAYRTALERVGEEARRLNRTVDDLLWLARADEGSASSRPDGDVDIRLVAGECASRFTARARERGLRVTVDVGDDPAFVRAPRDSIDRLVAILIDNACKFAPDGGQVRVLVRRDRSLVSLTVEDDGPGVPASERSRIFDRFHRASDVAGGTGLGLSIAASILGDTSGHCRVDTSPLGGARFVVSW